MDLALQQSASARLITAEERDKDVPAVLRYTAHDPFAVHFDFPPQAALDGEPVSWTFARSLLEEGLRGPAGGGDVHLWPCGRERTVVEFHSPYGLALLQFDTATLRRFLLRTYALVAAGREDVGEAVDRGLSGLFDGV
ncbi:SsgA family sporulation/cell division regulator [Streptomyces sp.]|uniref:SsgA family sporulation/cell division regulator n=1 Tax=Streptomyces sp. TaxID=1931 RepID=UPI002D70A106|nr:SsgA family sporulation/cell division regulator [Streptomyces sp.]HZF92361.1 SsgA family sporulation/cell division regulator [Streptomyces sp.]